MVFAHVLRGKPLMHQQPEVIAIQIKAVTWRLAR